MSGHVPVPPKRKEICKYEAPFPLYSMNWSVRPDKRFRLALGSFVEEYNNKVQIVQLNEEVSEFAPKATFDHPYPTTKIIWIPDGAGIFPDLLATSGDYLRVWRVHENEARLEVILNNNKNSDFCAPLTSFDWNEVDQNLIGTSSIDTTCTIWGLETGQVVGRGSHVTGSVKTQLIAHDKEVYDIAFSRAGGGKDMFASVGADGSVRMFDLRHLEHSTIIYEDPKHTPLVRLAWNKQDPNYLATIAMDAHEVIVLDVRVPCSPVARLSNHRACVNGLAWAPHSSVHICTAGDDRQALIWDIQSMPRDIEDPILAARMKKQQLMEAFGLDMSKPGRFAKTYLYQIVSSVDFKDPFWKKDLFSRLKTEFPALQAYLKAVQDHLKFIDYGLEEPGTNPALMAHSPSESYNSLYYPDDFFLSDMPCATDPCVAQPSEPVQHAPKDTLRAVMPVSSKQAVNHPIGPSYPQPNFYTLPLSPPTTPNDTAPVSPLIQMSRIQTPSPYPRPTYNPYQPSTPPPEPMDMPSWTEQVTMDSYLNSC
ncbi:unnamed protein product [Cyprideis torosa]|uniref:DDB1- and CUL4-associated factor 7 n=1 Tax=Cyprideis torosa TaxID=163714 RepID=A0A7R8W909_9CRUS|nr:unnamed protein product [Cyprideis torosa]CAG0889227.1 unnamed protein product [Cyprideis torosa]